MKYDVLYESGFDGEDDIAIRNLKTGDKIWLADKGILQEDALYDLVDLLNKTEKEEL